MGLWNRIFGRKNDPSPRRLSMVDPPRMLPPSPTKDFASLDFMLSDRFATHPGYGLTPRMIVELFAAAERGWPAHQCDLFEDVIESDPHLRSAIQNRREAVSGKDWVLLAGGDSTAEQLAAQVLENALREVVPNWRDTVDHQLSHVPYGYAASEIVWDLFEGWWIPSFFANDPARRFRFDFDDKPNLLTGSNPTIGEPLDPGRWIFSRNPGRLTVRTGLMRTLTFWSLFKRLSVRDWVTFAAIFGIPFVHGKYSEEASDDDKEALELAVKKMGKQAAAVIAQSCELAITWAEGGGKMTDVHGAIVDLCDQEISKLVSGATLTSEMTGQAGSYAASRVHQDTAFNLIEGDAGRFADVFRTQLARPFMHFNGVPGRPPALKIHISRSTDPFQRARTIATVQALGLKVSAQQMYTEFQLRRPSGPDDTLAPSTSDGSQAAAGGKGGGGDGEF